jgi:hypothetical protein
LAGHAGRMLPARPRANELGGALPGINPINGLLKRIERDGRAHAGRVALPEPA